MADDKGTILVRSARPDNRIVLWDIDDAHPGGEVLIAADFELNQRQQPVGENRAKPVEVGLTGPVSQKLASGDLVRVSGSGSGEALAQAEQMEKNTGREPVPAEEIDRIMAEAQADRDRLAAESAGLDTRAGDLKAREEELERRERALADREASAQSRPAPVSERPADPPLPPADSDKPADEPPSRSSNRGNR